MPKSPRKARVLMLLENHSFPDDTRVADEAFALAEAGYAVSVISPTSSLDRLARECVRGVSVYRYPKSFELSGVLGYGWEYAYSLTCTLVLSLFVMWRQGFDVVHAHAPPDMFVLITSLYRLLGKQIVLDQHDLSPELYQAQCGGDGNRLLVGLLRWFERTACRGADLVIATNESQRRVQVERCGVPPERAVVVRNGPRLANCLAVEPLPQLRQPGRLVIGYLGVIGVQDGVDCLIRVLHLLKTEHGRDDFLGLVVGDGPALPQLKSLTARLGLGDHVHFTGYLTGEDFHRHVASFDIAVTPDPSNSYNNSCTVVKVMDYMAQGKPIVSFDLPEHRVTAGGASLYARPNDERHFAALLVSLMDDPDRRRKMGALGQERARNSLAWEYQKENLVRAYDRMATGRNDGERPLKPAAQIESTDAPTADQERVFV